MNLIFVAGAYAAIWRIGTLVDDHRRWLTLVMTLMWSVVLIDRQHLIFSGMESTAHMAALWLCLLAGLTVLLEASKTGIFPGRWFLLFTVGTVLVTWSRLDSCLFSLSLYCYVVLMLVRRHPIRDRTVVRYMMVSAGIIAVGAAVQIGFFYLAGGTVIPVSGLVKTTGIGPENGADVWLRTVSVIFPFATPIDETHPLFAVIGALAFAVLGAYGAVRAFRAPPPLRYLYGFALTLGLTVPAYAAIVGPDHDPYWRWYLSAVFLFYILGISGAAYEIGAALNARLRRMRSFTVAAGIVIALAFLFVLFKSHRVIPHYLARVHAGQFLQQATAPDTILAAFNAGQLAFMSDRRTVNLDGLVNSYDYLENFLGRPDRLLSYLRENNVRYIVDYDFYWATDEILENTTLKHAFEIPGDARRRTLFIRELNGG